MAGGELQGRTVNPVESPRVVQVSPLQASLVRQVGLEENTPLRAEQVVVSGEDVGGAEKQWGGGRQNVATVGTGDSH